MVYNVITMNANVSRVVGKTIRSIRMAEGLTQLQVAQRLEKPQSYISKLESGERSLHLHEVFPLSKALGKSSHEVVDILEQALQQNNRM